MLAPAQVSYFSFKIKSHYLLPPTGVKSIHMLKHGCFYYKAITGIMTLITTLGLTLVDLNIQLQVLLL